MRTKHKLGIVFLVLLSLILIPMVSADCYVWTIGDSCEFNKAFWDSNNYKMLSTGAVERIEGDWAEIKDKVTEGITTDCYDHKIEGTHHTLYCNKIAGSGMEAEFKAYFKANSVNNFRVTEIANKPRTYQQTTYEDKEITCPKDSKNTTCYEKVEKKQDIIVYEPKETLLNVLEDNPFDYVSNSKSAFSKDERKTYRIEWDDSIPTATREVMQGDESKGMLMFPSVSYFGNELKINPIQKYNSSANNWAGIFSHTILDGSNDIILTSTAGAPTAQGSSLFNFSRIGSSTQSSSDGVAIAPFGSRVIMIGGSDQVDYVRMFDAENNKTIDYTAYYRAIRDCIGAKKVNVTGEYAYCIGGANSLDLIGEYDIINNRSSQVGTLVKAMDYTGSCQFNNSDAVYIAGGENDPNGFEVVYLNTTFQSIALADVPAPLTDYATLFCNEPNKQVWVTGGLSHNLQTFVYNTSGVGAGTWWNATNIDVVMDRSYGGIVNNVGYIFSTTTDANNYSRYYNFTSSGNGDGTGWHDTGVGVVAPGDGRADRSGNPVVVLSDGTFELIATERSKDTNENFVYNFNIYAGGAGGSIYSTSGNFTSAGFCPHLADSYLWGLSNYTQTDNTTATNAFIEYRLSADNSTWGDWKPAPKNTNLNDNGVCIQYRANITTTDTSISAKVSAVTFAYTSTKAPDLYLTNPENTTYTTQDIYINYSAIDPDGISAVWYSVNDTANVTITDNLSVTFPLGNVKLTLYANDTDNNKNESTIYFKTSDTTPPVLDSLTYAPSVVNFSLILGKGTADKKFYINSTITDGSGVNSSSVKLYSLLNGTSLSDCYVKINGTNLSTYCPFSTNYPTIINTTNYQWTLEENSVFEGTMNLAQEEVEDETHSTTAIAVNNRVKVRFLSVPTTSIDLIIFEAMVDNTTSTSPPLQTYACNSTYTTGQVAGSPNCLTIGSFSTLNYYDHIHTANSKHNVLSASVQNGKINNILQLTSTMQFILVANSGWNVYYVSNNTNSVSTANNAMNSWNAETYTLDSHLHTSRPYNKFNFWVYGCDNQKNCGNSSIISILGTPSSIRPTSPSIFTPTEFTNITGYYNITWLNSTSYNKGEKGINYTIEAYNLGTGTFNTTIVNNVTYNPANLIHGYYWNSSIVPSGQYEIEIKATDFAGLMTLESVKNITIDNEAPSVPLINSPNNYSNFSSPPTINWNASTQWLNKPIQYLIQVDNSPAFDTIEFSNYSINSTSITPTGLTEGGYYWRVSSRTSFANSSWTEARYFYYDYTPPEFYLYLPANTSYYTLTGIPINYSAVDPNLDKVVYNTGSGKNTTLTENTTITLTEGSHTLTFWANDSMNNYNSTSVTFLVNIITYNVVYKNPVFESEMVDLFFNVTATQIDTLSGNLTYNGTIYTPTINFNKTHGSFKVNLEAPLVNLSKVAYFSWNYTLNGVYFNTTTYNQTINDITPLFINTSCTIGTSASMCFKFKDEENLTALNASVSYNFKFGLTGSYTQETFGSLPENNGFCLCANTTTYSNYTITDGEIQYSESGYSPRRFYTFSNQKLSDKTINITLYLLKNSLANSFLFEFKTTSLANYVGKYASLLRWYPDLNEYNVVDMGKTDSKGQTIMRVHLEDVDYRVGLYEPTGTLIKLLNATRFACLTSPCTYSTQVATGESDYTSIYGVETSIDYDTTSHVWTYIWNDPSQNTESMRFVVTRERGDSSVTICDTTGAGTTGVLSCDSTGYTGTLVGKAYRISSPSVPIAQKIISTITTPLKNATGLFISFIVVVLMAFVGIFSPIASMILGLVGLVIALKLGVISVAIFIALGGMIGIVIHFLKRT